jgi:hypothetical protein
MKICELAKKKFRQFRIGQREARKTVFHLCAGGLGGILHE